MRKFSIAIFVSLVCGACATAKSTKSKIDKGPKTLKSDLGFEITRPDCWKMEPNPAESDSDDIKKADPIDISPTNECANYRSSSDGSIYAAEVSTYRDYTTKGKLSQIARDTNWAGDRGGPPVLYRKLATLNGSPVVLVCENLHDLYVRWKVLLYCKNKAIWLGIMDNTNIGPKKLKDIKSGKMDLPADEASILESFKCANGQK